VIGSAFHQPGAIKFGPDQLWQVGDKLIINSPADMSEWGPREFARPAIVFQARRFFLRSKTAASPPFRFRYELWPWPSDHPMDPARVFVYDREFVAERDGTTREERRTEFGRFLLIWLYPVLGFASRKAKERLRDKWGMNPTSATRLSLFLEVFAAFMLLIFWSFTGGMGELLFGLFMSERFEGWSFPGSALVFLVIVLAFTDTIVRFDDLLREREFPRGFLEWIAPLFHGKNRE